MWGLANQLSFPLRSLCTYGRARICVLCISLAALIYNIPRFLEVTWVSHFDASLGQNRTEVRPTPLRQDPTYIRYFIPVEPRLLTHTFWWTLQHLHYLDVSSSDVHCSFRFPGSFELADLHSNTPLHSRTSHHDPTRAKRDWNGYHASGGSHGLFRLQRSGFGRQRSRGTTP